jgi:multicomponent Na+:H+ antiporter subunit D
MILENFPALVIAVPLLAAFAVNLLGRLSRAWIAPLVLGSLAFSTIASVMLLTRVLREGTVRYVVGGWRAPFGIELVVDPLSGLMLVVVAAVALVACVSVVKNVEQELPGKDHLFFTLLLILIAGLLGLVVTGDAFNLYVLLEITSITTYGLIAMGPDRAPLSSFNYIIMGTIGACFYLLGVGYLYILTGSLNMADIALILPGLEGQVAVATAFAFLLVGFWVKMAFFPLHSWLPNAYSHAPNSVAVVVAPLMTKVTVYLMLRIILTVFSVDYAFYQHAAVQSTIVWVAAGAIVCASFLALAQRDLKRMLTYIIVAEVGYMVGGAWLANSAGMTGAVLHIVNDALMTLCMFLAVLAIVCRIGDTRFESLTGIFRRMPITMAAFTLGAFSMIGVPPTCGFFSKWYLILGGVEAGQWGFVIALVVSSLVNAVLFFRIIEIGYFRLEEQDHAAVHGNGVAEAPLMILSPLVLTALALLVVGFGSGLIVNDVIRLALPAGF